MDLITYNFFLYLFIDIDVTTRNYYTICRKITHHGDGIKIVYTDWSNDIIFLIINGRAYML